MHLEAGPKIGPLWHSSKKKLLAHLNTCMGFPKPRLVPRGTAALLRKAAGSCYGIGAGSCYTLLLRTIGSCYFQSSLRYSPAEADYSNAQKDVLNAQKKYKLHKAVKRLCYIECTTHIYTYTAYHNSSYMQNLQMTYIYICRMSNNGIERTIIQELESKLLVSALIGPIIVPYIGRYITPPLRSLDYSSCSKWPCEVRQVAASWANADAYRPGFSYPAPNTFMEAHKHPP